MELYKILSWDTTFFGKNIATILCQELDSISLGAILKELKDKGIELVYWPASTSVSSKRAALVHGGLHVDRKITFVADAQDVSGSVIFDIQEYSGPMNDQLVSLAVQCGHYSRFSVDPFMPAMSMEKLYTEWMTQSVNKKIADAVLVANINSEIAGVITLGNKNGSGDIGLLSVDIKHRDKDVGKQLVFAAQQWFVANGFQLLRVVTQGNNIAACKLYEKCGYEVGVVQEYYHFWLNK